MKKIKNKKVKIKKEDKNHIKEISESLGTNPIVNYVKMIRNDRSVL